MSCILVRFVLFNSFNVLPSLNLEHGTCAEAQCFSSLSPALIIQCEGTMNCKIVWLLFVSRSTMAAGMPQGSTLVLSN